MWTRRTRAHVVQRRGICGLVHCVHWVHVRAVLSLTVRTCESNLCVYESTKRCQMHSKEHTHTTAIIFSALEGEERLTVVPSIFLSYIYTFSVPFHYFFQFEKLNINALRARLNQHISSTWMIFFFSLARHLRFCIYRFVCCVVAERARNKQRCVTDQIEQLKVN